MNIFSKQLLTEGERFIVTFFNLFDLESQGMWDAITALGALFPRFIFRPLEEGYYLLFREQPGALISLKFLEIQSISCNCGEIYEL